MGLNGPGPGHQQQLPLLQGERASTAKQLRRGNNKINFVTDEVLAWEWVLHSTNCWLSTAKTPSQLTRPGHYADSVLRYHDTAMRWDQPDLGPTTLN